MAIVARPALGTVLATADRSGAQARPVTRSLLRGPLSEHGMRQQVCAFAVMAGFGLLLPACVGGLLEPGAVGGPPPAVESPESVVLPEGKVPVGAPDAEKTIGPPMLRRLTAEQFHRSLVDLLGEGVPEADILVDPPVFGFHVDARAGVIRDLDAEQLLNHAERVAEWAVGQPLGRISPCETPDGSCRRRFFESFGSRIFRRPLSEAELQRYEALTADSPTFRDAARVALTAMIQSPNFLYRRELGGMEDGGRVLSAYEVATHLSYALTHSTPDDELLRAAEEGRLRDSEDILREMERLLRTEAAREVLGAFLEGWLEIDDLAERVKENENAANFRPEVRASMLGESRALFLELFFNGGTFRDLLSSSTTYLDQTLSQYYQIYGVGGDGFSPVEIPEGRRAPGLLGHGSFLARHALAEQSSPVLRGYTIRKRIMCEEIAPPPPGIDTMISPPENATTTREKYTEHSTNAACSGCHELMDPIGFTFENFDHFGRFRDQQNGHPIDTTGRITPNSQTPPGTAMTIPGGEVPLADYGDLISFLSASEEAEACFARYLTYYLFGVEGIGVTDVVQRARQRGGTLKNFLEAIVTADHFTRRTP